MLANLLQTLQQWQGQCYYFPIQIPAGTRLAARAQTPGVAENIQVLVTLFAAAQAPVLVSRDLRHRSIVLYLARPLPPALFALTYFFLYGLFFGPLLLVYAVIFTFLKGGFMHLFFVCG